MECSNCDYYKAHNCRHQCMDLPDGKTCADCMHIEKCVKMFGAKKENKSCGFEPIRFKETSMHDKIRSTIKEYTDNGALQCISETDDIISAIRDKAVQNGIPNDIHAIHGFTRMELARRLWDMFGAVPMNPDTEEMEEEWNGFPAGTFREDIWHWFEETFNISVAEDLMGQDCT